MDMYGNEWQWSWEDPGEGRHLGRVFHKKVKAYRTSDKLARIYKLGDTVVMKGEDDDTWTAQIVELFQVKEDDEELREVLQMDSRKVNSTQHYELMRVTLRWFYNPSDMNMHTLRSSSCPNNIRNEIYFSDHVEKEGYNDITVIEGKAWLVPSKRQREDFLQNPPAGYWSGIDQVRIVRCFVNSVSPELAVRELDTGELKYLLKHPTVDKELFETSRQRMRGLMTSNGTVLHPPSKGTGAKQPRRRRRTIREPVDVEDEEFDPDDGKGGSKKREPKIEGSSSGVKRLVSRERKERKRKRDVGGADSGMGALPDSESMRMQSLKQANEEVLDMVASLNQSALPTHDFVPVPDSGGEGDGDDDDGALIDVDTPEPRSGTRHALPGRMSCAMVARAKQPVKRSETIVLDGGDISEKQKRKRAQSSLKSIHGKEVSAPSGPSSRHDKTRPSFMPSGQDRKSAPDSKIKDTTMAGGLGGKMEQPDRRKSPDAQDVAERIAARKEQLRAEQDKVVRKGAKVVPRKESTREQAGAKVGQVAAEQRNGKRVIAAEAMVGQKDAKKLRISDDVVERRNLKKMERKEGKVSRKDTTGRVASSSPYDSWEETRQALKKLEVEFKSMSIASQELFRSHVDITFDLAVAKVTGRGLFGNIEPNNEQLTTITREILDELRNVISEEAGNEILPVTRTQGGTGVAS